MVRLLADAKDTLLLLESMPEDPRNATAADVVGEDASCAVGKAGFVLGAGTPTTSEDTPLCTEGETQIPTAKTYEVTMNIYRFFDPETRQIDPEEDFFFQAVKEFGSEIVIAYRQGGKEHTDPPEAGDEWSFYKLIAGGMGRSTETGGYSKRVAHLTVTEAHEDITLGTGA